MNRRVNPYVAGAPLRGGIGFFGRRDTIEWVSRELHNPATNALVLFGQRRIGKTSLLLQLQTELPSGAFLPVYFDLQDQTRRALGVVLADLADTLAENVGMASPVPKDFDDQGHFFEREFLPQAYEALGDSRRLVFLFDEFDVMDQVAEAELPDTAAAKALLAFLRRLMTADPRPAFVFVVGRRAEDLSVDFMATFKSSLVHEMWVLQPENAEALVRQAEVNGSLRFTEGGVKRILSLTNDHPYLTQLLCQRIWERAYAANPVMLPVIDAQEVETATTDALEAGEQALVWLWNGLSPAEKIYAAALAEVAEEGQTIPEDRIIQVLTAHAARLRTREVELAPRDLVKRRVLETAGEREYRFAVELFRRWVRFNKPVRDVKDELDRIEPVADRLYEIGRDYFNRRQWDNAVRFFHDALTAYPRHFRARLYLGETLMEQGHIDEAVSELHQAYELDRDEARLPLARALVTQAEAQEKAGDEEGALAISGRALEVSPNEQTARVLVVAIWTRRGDAALERNDLEAALSAYQEAGDASKIAHIRSLQAGRAFSTLVSDAKAHEQAERWTEAAAAYEQLIPQAPDEESREAWQAALERCRVEEKLASFFLTGMGALAQRNWNQAQHDFSEVIHHRPDYRKNGRLAASLLEQAVMERKEILSKRQSLIIAVLAVIIIAGLVIIALRKSQITLAEVYFDAADYRRGQGEFSVAIPRFNLAIRLAPDNSDYYYFRAWTYRQANRDQVPIEIPSGYQNGLEAAIADFDKAIELRPNEAYWVLERASTYREMGDLENALADNTHAIELASDDPSFYIERVWTYRARGELENALADNTRAIELNSGDPNLYIERAITYRDMDDLENALADHNRALELNSDNPGYYYERAWTYREAHIRQNFTPSLPDSQFVLQAAIDDFSQAIERDPSPGSYHERAMTYREIGNLEEALADHDRAIELAPNDPYLYFERAVTYQRMDKTEEALASLNQAVDLNSENPDAYYYRGVFYRDYVSQPDQAVPNFEKYLELADRGNCPSCEEIEQYIQEQQTP